MKATFIRSAMFALEDDGRTLTGCIVPYSQVADIVELDESTGELVRYREQFLPHSLAAFTQGFKARGSKFLPLLIDHQETFNNLIGHCTELRDEDDGAYASFRLYEDVNFTKVRSVLTESHTGLSVGFQETRAPKVVNGVVSRVQVHVGHVAATPVPAYAGAGIESIRSNGITVSDTPGLNDVRAWLAEQRKGTNVSQ